jgi:hypothetical protein
MPRLHLGYSLRSPTAQDHGDDAPAPRILPDLAPALKASAEDRWLRLCAGRFATGKIKVGGKLPDKPDHPLEKSRCHEQGLSVGI